MKLYWSPRSPFVRKVMVCAHELGLAECIDKIYAGLDWRSRCPRGARWFETFGARASMQATLPYEEQ